MPVGYHKKEYTAIDLFCGCGGLSLGLKRAGFSVKAAVEIDEVAAQTFKRNHPTTTVLQKDVRNIDGAQLRRAADIGNRTLDLLAGCPPCQGFSRIRRKNKHQCDDARNDLVLEFLRLAKELYPKIILLENVPGLKDDRRFQTLIRSLRRKGYQCDWGVLNAAEFGIPQRRKRLILMASRVGNIELPRGKERKKTVRDFISRLEHPTVSRDALQRMHMKSTPRIKKMISRIPINGGSRTALGWRSQLACHKKFEGFKDVYGRMRWDDVAPTLTGGCYNPSKGRFLHPRQNRPITLREAALLQTFPKSYRFPVNAGMSSIARLIGDALPPLFGEAQGKHILSLLEKFSR